MGLGVGHDLRHQVRFSRTCRHLHHHALLSSIFIPRPSLAQPFKHLNLIIPQNLAHNDSFTAKTHLFYLFWRFIFWKIWGFHTI
jgi:hypothetical protein